MDSDVRAAHLKIDLRLNPSEMHILWMMNCRA